MDRREAQDRGDDDHEVSETLPGAKSVAPVSMTTGMNPTLVPGPLRGHPHATGTAGGADLLFEARPRYNKCSKEMGFPMEHAIHAAPTARPQ